MTEKFTALGCNFWSWAPIVAMGEDHVGTTAKLLWLALYSSPTSKRLVPGLWQGTPNNMGEMLRMSGDLTWQAFERLRSHRLAEYDYDSQIARLTMLPDATNRAHNDKAVFSWWRAFNTLPDVVIRNVHIHVLWWMVSAAKISQSMKDAWDRTFGSLEAPPNPVRLWAPLSRDAQTSFPNILRSNEVSTTLVVPGTTGTGTGIGTGTEGRGESVRGEGEDLPAKTLVLRTADEPFSVDDLVAVVAALQGGTWSVSADQREALEREILHLSPKPDLGLLRDHLTAARCSVRQAAELLSGTGHLASAFSRARQWAQERDKRQREMDERAAYLAQARAQAGV